MRSLALFEARDVNWLIAEKSLRWMGIVQHMCAREMTPSDFFSTFIYALGILCNVLPNSGALAVGWAAGIG